MSEASGHTQSKHPYPAATVRFDLDFVPTHEERAPRQ